MPRFLLLGVSAAALLPAAAAARLTPVPLGNGSVQLVPDPAPTPTPVPIPALPTTRSPTLPPVVLPPFIRPTPEATRAPASRPSPTAPPQRAAPQRPTAARTPSSTPATRRSLPRAVRRPTPTPIPSASPTGVRSPIETVVLNPLPAGMPLWPWLAGGALALLVPALLLLRRRGEPELETADELYETFPEEAPAAPPSTARPAVEPARLSLALRPTRAGINLLTATVDAEVIVINTGDMPVRDVRAAVSLIGTGGTVDADLGALAAQPIGRPAVPPFALAPGGERRFRAVAALPIAAIHPLTAGGRPMLVPLVVVSIAWIDATGERRLTRGFAIGIERVDSAKLAPLWLDVPPRSYDTVAARAHEPAVVG